MIAIWIYAKLFDRLNKKKQNLNFKNSVDILENISTLSTRLQLQLSLSAEYHCRVFFQNLFSSLKTLKNEIKRKVVRNIGRLRGTVRYQLIYNNTPAHVGNIRDIY